MKMDNFLKRTLIEEHHLLLSPTFIKKINKKCCNGLGL